PGPIWSDSGGYQVFSLGAMRKITEDGACFQSHLDGSSHLLTPEKAGEIQEALCSDIAVVVVEGGRHEDLRRWCADELSALDFDGLAVGGLGVGEGEEKLNSVGAFTAQF